MSTGPMSLCSVSNRGAVNCRICCGAEYDGVNLRCCCGVQKQKRPLMDIETLANFMSIMFESFYLLKFVMTVCLFLFLHHHHFLLLQTKKAEL